MFLNRDRSMLIICSGDKAPTLGCSCCSQTKRGSEVDHKNVATADEHLRHRGLQKFFSFHLMTGSIHKLPGHFLSILRNLRTSQPWKVAGRKYDHPLKPTIFPAQPALRARRRHREVSKYLSGCHGHGVAVVHVWSLELRLWPSLGASVCQLPKFTDQIVGFKQNSQLLRSRCWMNCVEWILKIETIHGVIN